MLPSAAKPPEWTSPDSRLRFELLVQPDKSPVSKPSAKSGEAAAGCVTETPALCAEALPAASCACTVYV